MYCLPKVHKPNLPLRPIISSINTVNYNLAKFLVPYLTSISSSQYTLDDTNSFTEYLKSLTLPSNFIMASFDIKSLFTNVPLSETTKIILDKFNSSNFYNIDSNTMKKLLDFSTTESCFIFNGDIYNQIDGVAMGSPIGPTYANIFMSHHESIWLDECPPNFKPIAYKRYVDDTFLIFNHKDHIQLFLDYLNSKHSKIQFTCEIEKDNSLPFLDVNVSKINSGLQTSIFRKPTFTGQGLNWFSFCPSIYKYNSIKTLINRAYSLSSTYLGFHHEIEFLRDYFRNNNFPLDKYFSIVRSFLHSKFTNKPPFHFAPKLVKYVKIPFYGNPSYQCRKKILKLLRNTFPGINFRIILTNNFKLSNFFNIKDKIPDLVTSNIVYEFNCPSCASRYVGASARALKIRVSEHLGRSHRTGTILQKPPFSAIRDHSHTYDHPFSINDFKIIAKFSNSTDTFIGESILIQKNNPDLNRIFQN